MLKTGERYLEGLRDGRLVYIGNERVADVTTHPAFRNAARSVAAIYDMKSDPANRGVMAYQDGGEWYSSYFLRAHSVDDLRQRSAAHKKIADLTYGMFGRSPDHVASFVAGLAILPSVLDSPDRDYAANLLAYYEHMRAHDIYAAYAVLPPHGARDPAFFQRQNLPVPTLSVVREDDSGVVLSGMKMLATGAIFADEIWIGNLLPLAADQGSQAITCAVPCNAPGLSLWSRKPMEPNAASEFDSPLSWRFDESDAMVLCDETKVPWERVFVHNDAPRSSQIYVTTPSHVYGNHQSNVRFLAKLQLIVGLASKVAQANGADAIPAVRETLGRLAALEASLRGMIEGQISAAEDWPEGWKTFNRRIMYAALNFCTENYSAIIDTLRELTGGGIYQLPADATVMQDPGLRDKFEQNWLTPQLAAADRMKLFRLVWDLVGSEFAGRHQSYEKFYAGPSFVIRNHSMREAPWDEFHGIVERLLGGYDVPESKDAAAD